jgi:UDP-N-acetylmuramoyl-L-alanyl-D-glutamate--2,6-diaminopimelate ligase
VNLNELIADLEVVAVTGDRQRAVSGLAYDSRRVRTGDAFFALAGLRADGARFVNDAVRAGAAAVVSAPGVPVEGAAHVEVREPRLALAQAAGTFYRHPSRDLAVVAVTGTNGKTTTTWMLESIFRAAGWSAGVIGTTGARFAGQSREISFTTPEAPELQSLLGEMRERGVKAVAMEVSSHSLALRRTWGLQSDVCVFTNLTQDHLDYHGTMEKYLDAKLMLFDGRNGPNAKRVTAVVNADDPAGVRVIEAARRTGARVLTFGTDMTDAPPAMKFDLSIHGIGSTPEGLRLGFAADGAATRDFPLPLLGHHNAFNAAAAYLAAVSFGLSLDVIERGLSGMPAVPGRLERVDQGQPFLVVVDYAHTPDALERALHAAREHARGRVLLVFGCGGDRDRGKRPLMGAVASRSADQVWITNDNPRSEDPAAIAREILAGATGDARPIEVELDRRTAISRALASARMGDLVLIAGKGHETTQTIGERVLPFDDRAVARELLARGRPA